jgi:putative ABC transport system substrate-binding protein
MSGRRTLLLAAGGLLALPLARAQKPARIPTLGILDPHPKSARPKGADNPIGAVLKKRGWVPGETILIDAPDAGGREDRLPELAAALVARKVDVIFTNGPDAALAAARATRTIPIVFWGVLYPVERGLIDSYARPGRNVTGVAFTATPESDAKRLEFLREIAPAARRLAFLSVPTYIPTVSGNQASIPSTFADTARAVGYDMRSFSIEKQEDLEGAFAAILEWGAQALVAQPSTLVFRERMRIIDFANRNRLPSAFTLWDYVEAGGLIAYAIDWRPTVARSFEYVDRILRGAKPSDLPVELPSNYQLAVNLKTAKLLGLKFPPSILLRADRVIE